jgi:hypothetical protein
MAGQVVGFGLVEELIAAVVTMTTESGESFAD